MSLIDTAAKIYFVESGDGNRLSPELTETDARALAISARERLCRQVVEDDEVIGDELVFDYGVSVARLVDDRGAELCDECGNWSVELVSADHSASCSLNPKNIVN
jgi:hypothetical protein